MSQYPQQPPAQWSQSPGAPAAFQQYGTGGPMRPLSGLSTAVRILLGITGFIALVNAVTRFDRARILEEFKNGDGRLGDLFDADDRVTGSIGLYAFAFLATAIVFIIWQFRHAKNAEALGAKLGLGPGWAIGGWFIPLANYVLPPLQLFESSKQSHPQRRGAGIIIVWGVLHGIGIIVTFLAYLGVESDDDGNLIINSPDDIERVINAERVVALGFTILMVAAIVGIVMVGRLTKAQAAAQPTAAYQQPSPYQAQSFGAPPPAPYAPGPPAAPAAPPVAPPPPPVEPEQTAPPSEPGPPPIG